MSVEDLLRKLVSKTGDMVARVPSHNEWLWNVCVSYSLYSM